MISLSDVTILLSGEFGLTSFEIRRENMAEASPEPYENRVTRLPASSSTEQLKNRQTEL